ncbi:MAG: hypothetical protein PVI13_09945 [Desulfobacterales bacterium]
MVVAAVGLWCISPSLAEVGVTDACQEDVRDLTEKISDNRDDYTAESRRKARKHLLDAKTNRLNPVKCRKNILDAREGLRKGKRDKKKND